MVYVLIWLGLSWLYRVIVKKALGYFFVLDRIACFLVAFITTMGVAYVLSLVICEYATMEFTFKQEEPLYAIQDNAVATGYFVLGSGSVDGDMKYVYLTEKDGGKCIKSISSKNVIIYEQEENRPRLEVWEGKSRNKFLRLFQVIPKKLVKIYVPKGAVKYKYDINLQ